ncbi:MAG: hypothetical protein ACM31C_13755 [Acidobacteriota bacterium]
MIESFVDLTYRGLSLGRRVKLSDVRPTTGYVEIPAPMPVGTPIGILTDDTVALDAVVVEIHEQVAGSDRPPGMVVKPKLDGDAAKEWWTRRVSLPEAVKPAPPAPPPPPPKVPESVVVVSRRMTNPGIGVPAIVDDGQDTGVMDAIDPAQVGEPIDAAAVDPDADTAIADVPLHDDGKKTIAMNAVDLAALGLASSSGQLPVQTGADDDSNGNGDKPEGKSRRKRKRR